MYEDVDDYYEDYDEESVAVTTPEKKWYLIETPNGNAYTPYRTSKRIFDYIGDGTVRKPTPKEIVDYITTHKNASYIGSGYFVQEIIEETDSVETELPAGVYSFVAPERGKERLIPMTIRTDDGIELGDVFGEVRDRLDTFLKNEQVYRDHGLMYKLGLLLYGPPGNGKTTLIRKIVKHLLPKESLVIVVGDQFPTKDFLARVRDTLPDRLKIFVFEELSTTILYSHTLSQILDFLDGEASIDRSFVIATTNYPERIPGNMIERPSRFDDIFLFGNPKEKERRSLLDHFLKRPTADDEVLATNGLSIDAIKQVCLLSMLNAMTIPQAVAKMKKRVELARKEFAESGKLGF